MLHMEVLEHMSSMPDTKTQGRLTIRLQTRAGVTCLFHIGLEEFPNLPPAACKNDSPT